MIWEAYLNIGSRRYNDKHKDPPTHHWSQQGIIITSNILIVKNYLRLY